MQIFHCPVCKTDMSPGLQDWHFVCRTCRYEAATLEPTINDSHAHELIDESARESGLKALRVSNFQHLLGRVRKICRAGRLLEVGSAYGWFLEEAKGSFEVQGIEPDEQVFLAVRGKGLSVRSGYFPEAVEPGELYDVIVFNDVIEHIPNVRLVLKNCYEHLAPSGVLVLNLPNSSGIFYRLSVILRKLGLPGAFDRLWQVGLPSPHLHYFNKHNLVELLQESGFDVKETGRLATLKFSGLFTRISYTGRSNLILRLLLWAAIVVALPILRLLPSDIMYVIASPRFVEPDSGGQGRS